MIFARNELDPIEPIKQKYRFETWNWNKPAGVEFTYLVLQNVIQVILNNRNT